VEQVFCDINKVLVKAHSGRFAVIGKCGKRILSIVLNKNKKKYYVVTARDASKNDRHIYRKNI